MQGLALAATLFNKKLGLKSAQPHSRSTKDATQPKMKQNRQRAETEKGVQIHLNMKAHKPF